MDRADDEQTKILESLKENKLFKNRLLEVIYTLEKMEGEERYGHLFKSPVEDTFDFYPSELDTTIFVLNSYKEICEEYDPKIFERNTVLFSFANSARNMIWHKYMYWNHLDELVNNKLFISLLDNDDINYLKNILSLEKGNNKIENLSFSFERTLDFDLVLVVIYKNEMKIFELDTYKLFLSLDMFNKSCKGMFARLYANN